MSRISTQWDLVRHSSALKEIVKMRMKKQGLSIYRLAKMTEELLGYRVDISNLHHWITGDRQYKGVSQYTIIYGVCKILKIKVELKITDDETT